MKNILLIILFLLPLTVFSQTKKDTTEICIPYKVAKQMALDLNSLDSLKADSKLTNKELKETRKKVVYQDSIIQTMELKEENYKLQIQKEEEKYKIVDEQNNGLRDDIRKIKRKNTFIEIIGGSIVGALSYILIFK
jgi:maltodextrin utilization protein YvdJ